MLTAAIYARYSSELQRPTSIEDQVRLCREAAPRFECVVTDGFVYTDAEISGATGQRRGYHALLEAARSRRFDMILVEAQDRLWRSQGEMHYALERLRHWGVRVIAVMSGTDLTDRTGSILATVVGLKDELFLQDLRDKTRRGMVGQVRRGLSAGGRAYGYRSEPILDEAGQPIGARRIADPAEAAVVRRIFALYDAGQGPHAIARLLNAEHVPPPRPHRGGRLLGWTWTTINGTPSRATGILNNPLYVGRFVWNRSRKVRDPDTGKRTMRPRPQAEWLWTDAPELRIVEQDLWQRVQARRQGRRHVVPGNKVGRTPKYLFSGLLRCGTCGGSYTVKSRTYYACATHRNRGPAICANGHHVQRDRLEERLLKMIFGDVFTPDVVAYVTRQVERVIAELRAAPDERRQVVEAELARARTELAHIANAIRQGIVTPTTRTMLEQAERRIAELETDLRALPLEPPALPPLKEAVEGYLQNLRETMATDVTAAREMLAQGIGTITLRPAGGQLVAEMRGNLVGLLGLTDGAVYANDGAGSGI